MLVSASFDRLTLAIIDPSASLTLRLLHGTPTFLAPRPRKPPTSSTAPITWPFSMISSETSPIDSWFAPTTFMPIRSDESVWPLCCSVITSPADAVGVDGVCVLPRSEEHTSELQSLMRISYAVFCLKKKNTKTNYNEKMQTNRK